MQAPLRIKVSDMKKKVVVVTTTEFESVGKVMDEAGFIDNEHFVFTAVFGGKILKRELTLGFYGVKNDSVLFCVRKCLIKRNRKEEFLSSMKQRWEEPQKASRSHESAKLSVYARLSDLFFDMYELNPDSNIVYADYLDSRSTADMAAPMHKYRTNVDQNDSISESPLPNVFGTVVRLSNDGKGRGITPQPSFRSDLNGKLSRDCL